MPKPMAITRRLRKKNGSQIVKIIATTIDTAPLIIRNSVVVRNVKPSPPCDTAGNRYDQIPLIR